MKVLFTSGYTRDAIVTKGTLEPGVELLPKPFTYKDLAAMTGPSDDDAIVKRLYPDQAMFKKEEQRRFEILDAHWDVPLNELDLK